MCPNLSMNFQRDSSSACRRLASVANVMRCDWLVAYYTLKRSTKVSKLSMDHGGSPSCQVNASSLRGIGETRHKIASSLVYKFVWVRKAYRCSSGSVVPSYQLRLSGFQPKGMLASMMRSTKRSQRVVYPTGRCMWERLRTSLVLTVRRGCDFPWVRSRNVWAECSSPWGRFTQASNWSWLAFSFLSSFLWRPPCPQCDFGVAGEYWYLSWLLVEGWSLRKGSHV